MKSCKFFCLKIKTMQSLKNYVHCYLSQNRNFGISVFCCESRHQPDVKNFTAISFSGYLTFLVILAVPNNADFWTCSILISISRLSIYFSNFVLIVLDAPTTMGITTTFFVCHNLEILSQQVIFLSLFSFFITYSCLYFLVFPHLLSLLSLTSSLILYKEIGF